MVTGGPSAAGAGDDEVVTLTRGQLDALLGRLDRLEAERTPPGRSPSPPEAPTATVGRRRALLGLAGMAAAGAAAAVAPASPVAAADGDGLQLGAGNEAAGPTTLRVTGDEPAHGLAVTDGPEPSLIMPSALAAHVGGGRRAGLGIDAHGDAHGAVIEARDGVGLFVLSSGTGVKVWGGERDGVLVGLPPESQAAAVRAIGPRQLVLEPNERPDPPADEGTAAAGELRWTGPPGGGTLWACVAGTDGELSQPASWRTVASAATAGALHLLPTPARAYDSRPGSPPATGPKEPLPGGYQARTIGLAVEGGVPAGATGALLTVQLVNATAGNGNLTVWAGGQPRPQATTLVWGGDAGRFTTLAVTALSPAGEVQVAGSLPTHLVLDIVGYHR